MIKLLLSAAVFGLFLAAPANAMEAMKCDDASMMKMQTDMDAMSDPAMKVNVQHSYLANTGFATLERFANYLFG
jgi:hypothetical protein